MRRRQRRHGLDPPPSSSAARRPLPADNATRKAVAYSPFRSGNRDTETITPAQVLQELQLLVQARFGLIRLFDSSDAVAKLTLQVIRDNHLDIKVQLGAYVIAGNDSFNQAEVARAIALANDYADLVEAVSVGNETLVSWSFNKFTPARIEGFLATVRAGVKQPVTTDDNWERRCAVLHPHRGPGLGQHAHHVQARAPARPSRRP